MHSASHQGRLQWTPTSVTVGLETQTVIPSTPESDLKHSYDAIVIGARFTGLTAARDISLAHGSNGLLVDARDRIRGRTWTASAVSEDFDIGGTWIHGNEHHFFAQAYRCGLDRLIKTSNSTEKPEKVIYKAATSDLVKSTSRQWMAASRRSDKPSSAPTGSPAAN
ncbi:uncharacterized protein APUU_50060A [Aspergillus puulaauensis]|uniref:monoamine oxidase n=1 Tax=Aspergillus puulaauensis TaxID=1220207 RepID=A0A7R7XRB3_9EURO|nr:uncharacterized protein APUU_50060A [Aspergillus puulaauensis]BCS25349.1 hypothetical protein APUU_50060A [Aspergillus puulaauensis]